MWRDWPKYVHRQRRNLSGTDTLEPHPKGGPENNEITNETDSRLKSAGV